MMFSKRALIFLASALAFVGFLVISDLHSQADAMLRSHKSRNLQQIGEVQVDIYRTSGKGFLGLRRSSISRPRAMLLVRLINYWYNGVVKFSMGDFFDYDDPDAYNIPPDLDPCDFINQFVADGYVQNSNHISVVAANKFSTGPGLLACAAKSNSPLGNDQQPAALVFGAGAVTSVAGASLAHSIGHIIGFDHTTSDNDEGVRSYTECGLDLKYPFWQNDERRDGSVTGSDGVVYSIDDFQGRTNIMARFTAIALIQGVTTGSMGIYKSGYGPIFEQITQCWFDQAQ